MVSYSIYAQTNTENYILTTSYLTEYNGGYEDYTKTLNDPQYLFYYNQGANPYDLQVQAQVRIVNNILTFEIGGQWDPDSFRLKTGSVAQLEPLQGLTLELGELQNQAGSTGFFVKIDNGTLLIYRNDDELNGEILHSTITSFVPYEPIQYGTNISFIECFSGGQDNSYGFINIENDVITLNLGVQLGQGCNIRLGNIQYLNTSQIPDTELGYIINSSGNQTEYKVKIENNWLVFYSDTLTILHEVQYSYSQNLINITEDDKLESIVYFDGLGRPVQNIKKQAGGQGQDIITPIIYDEFGRQTKEYLSFSRENSSLNYETSIIPDNGNIIPINQQYLIKNPDDFIGVSVLEVNPYSRKLTEDSPLGRVIEQAAAGEDWAMENGHTVKFDYQSNGFQEVKQFSVYHPNNDKEKTNLVYVGYYTESELYKTVIKDENWQQNQLYIKEHTIEEFRNKQGQLLLKRTYVGIEEHDTYYVYNNFGNLSYVLPPEASDGILDIGNQGFRAASQTNYSWVKLVNVDSKFAEDYNKDLSEYNNASILNADIGNEYDGQGGFTVTTFANSDLVTLNISFLALTELELKKGELLSLKEYGDYKDTELGAIKGPNYDYYFSIKKNGIYVEGKGKLSAINETFDSSQKLNYTLNYTWPMLSEVDLKFAKDFDSDIRDYAKNNNLSPLNVYLDNYFGAQGGLKVSVDSDDNVSLNFNVNSNSVLTLKNGLALPLGLKRRLSDRSLGTISGQGFSYNFFLRDNTLYASGSGSFAIFNGNTISGPPPTDPTIDPGTVEGLCYIYHYDYRNRLIEKKIPGKKDWDYIIYNKLDLPVLTQDGKQRLDGLWLFTKYDAFGRVIYTGTYKNEHDRHYIQNTLVNNQSIQFETKTSTAITMYDDTDVFYTKVSFPHNGEQEVFTITYYDDYSFDIPTELGSFQNPYNQTVPTNTKTLVTGSKIRVLDTEKWITSVNYYDKEARPIYITSYNDYLNTVDKVSSHLDFVGRVKETVSTHVKDGSTPLIVKDSFTYDHIGRLLTQVQTIGDNEELIVNNHYDELGQLESKKVGGAVSSIVEQSVGLQTIDYSYNIRGWLKTINNDTFTDNDLFNFGLSYNDPVDSNNPLYNGNISETSWETVNDNNLRGYDYSYDALNRLKLANYHGYNQAENYSLVATLDNPEGVMYDKNGNIIRLTRMGLKEVSNQMGTIDKLVYDYTPKTNELYAVTDDATEDGFSDVSQMIDYLYDINGNMTQDLNKDITTIEYNHLNLPKKIIFGAGNQYGNNEISYIYDATGIKLEKKVQTYTGQNVLNTNSTAYINSYIYQKSGGYTHNGAYWTGYGGVYSLKLFSHQEGYVEPAGSNSYNYVYQYTDHLGNIRLSYKDISTTATPVLEIIEENNYYPFGLEHKGYNNSIVSANVNSVAKKFKYNGKELEKSLGYEMYEYEARHYDPAIARFVTIDPLAEDYSFQSTYNYAINNPVYFIDKLGMGPTDEWTLNLDGSYTWESDKGGDTIDYINHLGEDGSVESTEEIDVVDLSFEDNNSEIRQPFEKSPGYRTGMTGRAPGKGDMNWLEVIPEISTAIVVTSSNAIGLDPEVGLALVTMANMIFNPVGGTSIGIKNYKRIPKTKRGRGSVSPEKRDPIRLYTKKQKQEKLDEQGGICLNCGEKKTVDEVAGHHRVRHADVEGPSTTPSNLEVPCIPCHKKIHSKDD